MPYSGGLEGISVTVTEGVPGVKLRFGGSEISKLRCFEFLFRVQTIRRVWWSGGIEECVKERVNKKWQ
jgi:hypothetical protein